MDTNMTASGSGATLAPPPGITPAAGYPLQVTYDIPERSSRFWAIPLVGLLAKWVILIPHLLMIYVLGMVVGLFQLVVWVPVLFTGTYPEWAYSLTSGYLRWSTNVWAYLFGLTDQYPPFQLGDAGANGYSIQVELQRPARSSRFWAIPVVGLVLKYLILIPHFLILGVLGLVVGILQLVLWVPVLFAGRFPVWAHGLIGGYIRWYARVLAYQLGLNDQYPPFQLSQTQHP